MILRFGTVCNVTFQIVEIVSGIDYKIFENRKCRGCLAQSKNIEEEGVTENIAGNTTSDQPTT